jgi:hypothetical protein
MSWNVFLKSIRASLFAQTVPHRRAHSRTVLIPLLCIRREARESYTGADKFIEFFFRFKLQTDSAANRNFSAACIE